MSFQKEKDDDSVESGSGGSSFVVGLASAAVVFGVAIGAALSYIFRRRTENNSTTNFCNRKWRSEDCTICFDEVPGLIILPCTHRFHRACIIAWLEKKKICPTCRKPAPLYLIREI